MRDFHDACRRALEAFPALMAIQAELDVYAELLRHWQTQINLVGASTLPALWWRHFADSAQIFGCVPEARDCVDLGSGAGFPGVVLALLLKQSGGTVRLVESDTRKASFLREVSRETSTPTIVDTRRADTVIARESPPDLVTARAFASLANLAKLTHPWLESGTVGAFLTGSSATESVIPADLVATEAASRTGPGFVVRLARRDSEQA